ncbi:MAG: outer membrane protein assembly factor BamA [Bacteroidaceae bacterium]|nr:outer membrane protein assembly factor BamA [Bacteroidaceae bacterium]
MNELFKIKWALALLAALCSFLTLRAQDEILKVNPKIEYSSSPTDYVIDGIVIDGVKEYDQNVLLGISGLSIGQTVTIPKAENAITTAIRNFWAQGLFSDVSISADSIKGDRIYLHVFLAALPRISNIEFTGVKKTEREDLEGKIGLKKDNQISTNAIDRAKIVILNYFEEKGFKNATADILRTDDPNKKNYVNVTINIDKNNKTKVRNIDIQGLHGKQVNAVKRAMAKTREVNKFRNFLRSKKFVADKYAEDKENIIKKLNEWGYRDAYIVEDSVTQADEKHVDVHIKIDQGEKYYLRNITWVGNTIYTTDALNHTLGMKSGDVYNQTLLEKRLTGDNDAIGNQYYNNGYVFSRITPVETNVVGDSIDLEMRVVEGQQGHISRVNISGNERVFDEVIRRELRTKPGDLFNKEAIMRSLQDLSQMNQWDAEKLVPDVHPHVDDGTVDLTYKLVPKGSDQLEVSAGWGPVGITGSIGVKFTNFALQNLFKKDQKHRMLLPQGMGQSIELRAQTNGTYYQQYSIAFDDPWFGGRRPNNLSISFFYSKQTDVNSNYFNSDYYYSYYNRLYGYGTAGNYYNMADYYDPDKYVKMFGGSIGWGKRLHWPDDYFTFSAMIGYQRYMLRSWQYFIMTDGDCNNFNLTLSLNRNSSDQIFFPRKGSDLSMSVSATPPYSLWDGKDYSKLATNYRSSTYMDEMKEKYRWVEYHKWKFNLKTYTALAGWTKCPVLMTRTEFGLLGYYNKHKNSPFETFYVGGDGMSGYSTGYAQEMIGLRGYENGSLTPMGSEGYAYSRMTLELRYPLMLSQTSIYALAFLEGGNAWTRMSKFNPFDMKRSAGVGVRLWLPMIGLMGVDWAYGFDKVNGSYRESHSQFHFLIGREF